MWLEVAGATRHFDGRAALDGLDFGLAEGEIGCLLGPSSNPLTQVLRAVGETLPVATYHDWGLLLPEGPPPVVHALGSLLAGHDGLEAAIGPPQRFELGQRTPETAAEARE